MSAASRLQMDAFWRMVKFLLEGAGLPAGRPAAARADRPSSNTTVGDDRSRSPRRCSATWCWPGSSGCIPATYLARLIPRIRPPRPGAAAERAHGHRLGRHARRGHAGRGAGAAARPGRRRRRTRASCSSCRRSR